MKSAVRKKKFKIHRFLILLLIMAGGAAWFFSSFGKYLIAKAISDAAGVPAAIGHIKLDFMKGEAAITDLMLQNSPGFAEKNLCSIPEIFIAFDFESFLKMKPHIREIRINVDQITVEKSKNAGINLLQLKAIKDIYEYQEPDPHSARKPRKEPPPAKPVEMKIDKLDLTLGRARFSDYSGPQPVVKEVPLNVNHFIVKDLTNPAQVVQQIVTKTLQKLGLAVFNAGLGQLTLTAQQKFSEVTGSIGNWFQKRFSKQG